jgi:hypothetical protein
VCVCGKSRRSIMSLMDLFSIFIQFFPARSESDVKKQFSSSFCNLLSQDDEERNSFARSVSALQLGVSKIKSQGRAGQNEV